MVKAFMQSSAFHRNSSHAFLFIVTLPPPPWQCPTRDSSLAQSRHAIERPTEHSDPWPFGLVTCNQSSSWFEQQTKQFSDTRSVHRHLSCTHLIAEWSFTYQSCNRSLWLVIPDHLQCLLAHGGSIHNKCFIKSIKKLSMNKSDKTYCLRSLLHFGVINSTIFLIYLF